MEHLLPHEVTERELEMQEAAEIEDRREEELRVAEVEVEKRLSVEDGGGVPTQALAQPLLRVLQP